MTKWSLGGRHRELADTAETISKGAKVAATVAVCGAWFAAPTGLSAVGVSLGVISAPLLVTAAPLLGATAAAAASVAAAASLYTKYRSRAGTPDEGGGR